MTKGKSSFGTCVALTGFLALTGTLVGCGSSKSRGSSSDGAMGTSYGGADSGGTVAGGRTGTGGVGAGGIGSGGVGTGSGGVTRGTDGGGIGGSVTGPGGVTGFGGIASTGGVTGFGGIASTGGIPGFGGIARTGGISGSGGVAGSGGITGTGGRTGTGGITGTGGSAPPICGAETDFGALTPSAECSATALDAATVCPSTGPCPVGAAYALRCTGGLGGLSIAPTGSNGASLSFVTTTLSLVTRLFSLAAGTARIDDVPVLSSGGIVAADSAGGNRAIFANEMPGIWRVRETASGWRRESAVETGAADHIAVAFGARVLSADRAFVAYIADVIDDTPRLAVRQDGCWRTSAFPAQWNYHFLSLDLDSMNRPWVAWYEDDPPAMVVRMAGPDGTLYTPWSSSTVGYVGAERVVVLAGGLAGTASYPSLVLQRSDGIHVVTPDGTASTWTDRVLTGTAAPNDPCPTSVSMLCTPGSYNCTWTVSGAVGGFSAARTASGRTYVAWVVTEGEFRYSYFNLSPTTCQRGSAVPTSGASWIAITRADTGTEVLRVLLDSSPALPNRLDVVLAVRGDTLLVGATHPNGKEIRYQEVDTTRLP
jgi:hypothetical protein